MKLQDLFPKAILFDCDGVIVDTTPLHIRAFLFALKSMGVQDFDYAMIAGMTTRDAMKKIAHFHQIDLNETQVQALTQTKQLQFMELAEKSGREVFPDHSDLFRQLSTRYALGVVSSASRRSVDRAIKKCAIAPWIKTSLSAEDVVRSKPDPYPFLEGARRLGVSPSDTLVIEDAFLGIESAIGAGCMAIGFQMVSGPQGKIENLSQLLQLGVLA